MFLDADDYIEKDFLEELMAVSEDYDLVTSGYIKDTGADNTRIFDRFVPGSYRSWKDLDLIIDNMEWHGIGLNGGLTPYIWNKLYRTDLARQVFEEINILIKFMHYLSYYLFFCRLSFAFYIEWHIMGKVKVAKYKIFC